MPAERLAFMIQMLLEELCQLIGLASGERIND
jgi:hypothetical protein